MICGAGNENLQQIKKLAFIYTIIGADILDVSANIDSVKSAIQGINLAMQYAKQQKRPFIMVSFGMPGDPHIRKATVNNSKCVVCGICQNVCKRYAIHNGIIKQQFCIGCGKCQSVCKYNAISYKYNSKNLKETIIDCMQNGVQLFQLHASVKQQQSTLNQWKQIVNLNSNQYNSICLDRQNLSNSQLINRIQKVYEISKEKLIIQADGYPMSGGNDTFNSTLQSLATADTINKYFKGRKLNILLSGGTNQKTTQLAHQCDVNFNGVAVGSYARQIISQFINNKNFWNSFLIMSSAITKAKWLDFNIKRFDI